MLLWFWEADASVERGCWRSRARKGRKAASHHLGAGRRQPSLRNGEAGKSISLLLPPPEYKKNKNISQFSSLVLHLYPCARARAHTHTHTRENTQKQSGRCGGWGGKKSTAQAHLSSVAWAQGSPGPAASEREGRGFLSAPLPRFPFLQSRAAASLTPCAPGPRDCTTCLQPPPPPLRGRAWRALEPEDRLPPQICKALGANEERGSGQSRVLACKLYCNSSALFRRRQQNKV